MCVLSTLTLTIVLRGEQLRVADGGLFRDHRFVLAFACRGFTILDTLMIQAKREVKKQWEKERWCDTGRQNQLWFLHEVILLYNSWFEENGSQESGMYINVSS